MPDAGYSTWWAVFWRTMRTNPPRPAATGRWLDVQATVPIGLNYPGKPQERFVFKLYNVYSFGYPLGADSKKMLWQENFVDNSVIANGRHA